MATKGDLTRQKIIEKSMQLFSVKGYFHTSVSDIVEAAGLTKGGLYGHFRNKEEIWYAVYDECVRTWKAIVLQGVRDIPDPLLRVEKVVENSLKNYLGSGVFEGGCFLLNSLVELAGQSPTMSRHVLKGFKGFAALLRVWLEEAAQQGMVRDGVNPEAIANFLVIALNGAVPLYTSSQDPAVWQHTMAQLNYYLQSLRKPG